MAHSIRPRLSIHECRECNGPTVAVTVVDAGRFAPQRVRVAHMPGCKFFDALQRNFPDMLKERVAAETDRIISSTDVRHNGRIAK